MLQMVKKVMKALKKIIETPQPKPLSTNVHFVSLDVSILQLRERHLEISKENRLILGMSAEEGDGSVIEEPVEEEPSFMELTEEEYSELDDDQKATYEAD